MAHSRRGLRPHHPQCVAFLGRRPSACRPAVGVDQGSGKRGGDGGLRSRVIGYWLAAGSAALLTLTAGWAIPARFQANSGDVLSALGDAFLELVADRSSGNELTQRGLLSPDFRSVREKLLVAA